MTDARNVQRRLLTWFAAHRRDLPWRRTKNPYRTIVSELMLQQTQVSRVVPKYRAFLQRFPTVASLARARQSSVIAAWSGLGYNRRARNLHQLAQIVVREHGGKIPHTMQALRQLPGVGEYTAAAVACFAYGAPVALVDVNVRRVLGRIFHGVRGPERLTREQIWKLAGSLVPEKHAVAWNSMLMDFGATVCTQRAPKCERCPVQASCKAYPAVLTFSPERAKPKTPFVGSDRYWRGKIVRYLREQNAHRASAHMLRSVFLEQGLQNAQCTALLQSLEKDRLIRRRGSRINL